MTYLRLKLYKIQVLTEAGHNIHKKTPVPESLF